MNSPFQLVDTEWSFKEPSHWLASENVNNIRTTIAVVGPHFSYKTSLLNKVFKTTFQESNGRLQATQGVWAAAALGDAHDSHGIVLDLEDSSLRGNIERKNHWLAMAIAEGVIINADHKDSHRKGLDAECIHTILRLVEIKLEMMQFELIGKCNLLVVFRDCAFMEDEEVKLGSRDLNVHEMLHAEIARMWTQLEKPTWAAAMSFEDVFDLRFLDLPNLVVDHHSDENTLLRRDAAIANIIEWEQKLSERSTVRPTEYWCGLVQTALITR